MSISLLRKQTILRMFQIKDIKNTKEENFMIVKPFNTPTVAPDKAADRVNYEFLFLIHQKPYTGNKKHKIRTKIH